MTPESLLLISTWLALSRAGIHHQFERCGDEFIRKGIELNIDYDKLEELISQNFITLSFYFTYVNFPHSTRGSNYRLVFDHLWNQKAKVLKSKLSNTFIYLYSILNDDLISSFM